MDSKPEFPQLQFSQTSPVGFIQSGRTSLDVTVNNSADLKVVRCYFKADLDQHWLFVSAQISGLNRYSCVLPQFDQQVKKIEYRWLMAISTQVIRGQIHVLSATDELLFSPVGKSLANLKVYDELWASKQSHLSDSNAQVLRIYADVQRHGLTAGLYAAAELPRWIGAYSGYFGGFEYDAISQVNFPIKGVAPGLASSQYDSLTGLSQLLSPLQFSDDANLEVSAATPSIGGNDWSGYFKTTGYNNRYNLSASIGQSGGSVSITTSKSGLAHRFNGTINSRGDMLVYDSYDREDWTTYYGPASNSSVNLYDFIRAPSASDPNPPLNTVILSRSLPPNSPSSISASEAYRTHIAVSWSASSGASTYALYRCTTTSSSSCILLSNPASLSYSDTPPSRAVWYYRVKACNSAGCSAYSVTDGGKLKSISIVGPLVPLLF